MKNLIKNFFKARFTLEIPKSKKFLIFNIRSEKILSKILLENFNVLPTRFERISLIIFLYSLIKNFKDTLRLKNIYFNYLKTFIIYSKPLYVITTIDNDKKYFYKLKKYLKNIKFIAIQNGYRFFKDDLFENIENSDFLYMCDEYYCFGEQVKNYLKTRIQSKFYTIGSIKNNYCIKKENNKKSNICFISSFGISKKIFEQNILKKLHQFCNNKKIELEILARTNSSEEENFYYKILKNKKFIYHRQVNEFCSSYKIIDSAMVSITLNNTLGYENLARNNKTYFINIDDRNLNCESFFKFGYPEKFNDEGFFWTNKLDLKKIIEKINYIYDLPEQEWKTNTDEIVKQITAYDLNNTFLKRKLGLL